LVLGAYKQPSWVIVAGVVMVVVGQVS